MLTHPLDHPVLTRDFYYRSSLYVGGQHAAADYVPGDRPAAGCPLKASDGGVIAGNGWDFYSGWFIAEDTDSGFRVIYRHLQYQPLHWVGDRVDPGMVLGYIGDTGSASQGAHVHVDVLHREKIRDDAAIFYKNRWYAVDPELYLYTEDEMTEIEKLKEKIRELKEANDRQWKALQGIAERHAMHGHDVAGKRTGPPS